MSAEYGSSCEGCGLLQTEQFKGQTWFRCGAEGRWNGYTVGIERLNPLVPAWCPERKTDCHANAEALARNDRGRK